MRTHENVLYWTRVGFKCVVRTDIDILHDQMFGLLSAALLNGDYMKESTAVTGAETLNTKRGGG